MRFSQLKVFSVFILAVTVLLLSACKPASPSQSIKQGEVPATKEQNKPVDTNKNEVMEKKQGDENAKASKAAAPQYLAYSESTYEKYLGKQPVALFFYAAWCPTCRLEEQLMKEKLAELPAGTIILKADYDTETALKQKYNITMQSVVVVLDASGQETGRIGDFTTIDELKKLITQSFN